MHEFWAPLGCLAMALALWLLVALLVAVLQRELKGVVLTVMLLVPTASFGFGPYIWGEAFFGSLNVLLQAGAAILLIIVAGMWLLKGVSNARSS